MGVSFVLGLSFSQDYLNKLEISLGKKYSGKNSQVRFVKKDELVKEIDTLRIRDIR